MDYRGVIFDFNGTLFFDNDKHVKAWGAISQLLRNKGITDEELHEHFNGVPNKQMLTEKKVPFTIASASIKENIDFFVESFNLDKWIAPSDIVYDDGTYENKIAMFKKAADVIKTDIKDCLIIEDSLSGIQNAYNSGCNMIIVIDSANKKDEYEKLPGVIKVIDDFTQI